MLLIMKRKNAKGQPPYCGEICPSTFTRQLNYYQKNNLIFSGSKVYLPTLINTVMNKFVI